MGSWLDIWGPPPGPVPRCICGPDSTGEAPDCRTDCPQHGADPAWPDTNDPQQALD